MTSGFSFDESGRIKPPSPEQMESMENDSSVIVLSRGRLEDDQPYWAYVAIRPSRFADFMRVSEAGRVVALEDYGTVVRHGLNYEVPEQVRREMENEFGCDDNYLRTVTEKVLKSQATYFEKKENDRISGIVAMLKSGKGGGLSSEEKTGS